MCVREALRAFMRSEFWNIACCEQEYELINRWSKIRVAVEKLLCRMICSNNNNIEQFVHSEALTPMCCCVEIDLLLSFFFVQECLCPIRPRSHLLKCQLTEMDIETTLNFTAFRVCSALPPPTVTTSSWLNSIHWPYSSLRNTMLFSIMFFVNVGSKYFRRIRLAHECMWHECSIEVFQ